MKRSMALVLLGIMLVITGCGSSSKSASSGTATTTAASSSGTGGSSSSGTSKSSCANGAVAGKNGVVRVFCGGTAVAKATVNGTEYTLKGGECATSGGYFTVNIGTVTDATAKGARPDYFGLVVPPKSGAFTNATAMALNVGGKGYAILQNSGTVSSDMKSGTFTGTPYGSSTAITGTFTC